MVELHIDLIAESLSIYGSKVNIVDTEVTEFTGFKLLSPNIQTLRKDILYVCEPSALYKLKKSQIRGACFVCRAQAHVFEKYKAYINAIVVDYDTNTNDIANHLADLFSSMNDYKTRLQHAVLLQKGYQPLFDIAKEMFPGCTILMVDSGYNIVCSANTDFENDILPGADPDAVEHIKRLVKLGFYDKTELDQMAEHGYYNQGDKYLNPVISLPPNVCGCPLIVRSYHESSTFFAFVTCYYYYSNPTLVQQRMFKLLSDSLDDYFQITDYYEHVRPFHQQVIADLIENENSSEDFYRDRCLRLHLPQAGDFRLGLIYVSPSNSVRASHCALQLKAWCAVKNYGVFQYGSTVILLMVDWDSYSVRETVDADKNWQMLSDTLRDIGAYMGISLSFKHISGLSNAYHQAAEAAKQGHKSNMLDYVQKQYEETKKLFDAKKSCLKSGVEKYRVLWMQNMMWNNAGIMDWMEKEFNACSVMNGFPFLGRDQIEDVYDDEQIWFGLAKRCLGSPMVHSVCGPSEAYVKGIENIMNDYTIDIGIYAGHVGCKHAWAAGRMVTDVMEKKYGTPVLTFDLDSGDIRYKSTDEIKATITDFMETLAARGYDPAAERAKLLK